MHQPKKKKAHIEFQLKCSYTPMCTMIFVDVMAKNSFVITQNSLNRNVRGITFCDILNLQLLSSNAIIPANLSDLYF